MSPRTLRRLATRDGTVEELEAALANTTEGVEEVPLRASDLGAALADVRAGRWSMAELRRWAELLELLDDLTVEDDRVRQMVFALATPEIHPPLTDEHLDGASIESLRRLRLTLSLRSKMKPVTRLAR